MASGNASTSVLDLCSLSASASRETLRSLKGALACPEVPTILNSFAMLQIRECQRTICGAPNYKSRATFILNRDLNIRAGCLPVKSGHSSQATLMVSCTRRALLAAKRHTTAGSVCKVRCIADTTQQLWRVAFTADS